MLFEEAIMNIIQQNIFQYYTAKHFPKQVKRFFLDKFA